jgi:hypothetical protein
VGHTHHAIFFSHKKNESLAFAATWIDMDVMMFSEVGQVQTEEYLMITLTCGI